MKKPDKLKKWRHLFFMMIAACMAFVSCKDENSVYVKPGIDNEGRVHHEDGKPIVIDRFSPDSGRVATQMLIYGSNFGGYRDEIHVLVNGRETKVIGATKDGTIVYCIVPTMKDGTPREEGDIIVTDVKVRVGNDSVIASKQFVYTFSMNVSTFLGKTDQDGNSTIQDGWFGSAVSEHPNDDEAELERPFWMAFDKEKNLWLIEESVEPSWNNGALRFIDMQEKKVTTWWRPSNGVERPRTIAFTLDYDTLIVATDKGGWGDIGTIINVRDTITHKYHKDWQWVMRHKQCNGGAIHPKTGEYYFNSYEKSQVFKVTSRAQIPWNWGGNNNNANMDQDGKDPGSRYLFTIQETNWEFNVQIEPNGNFCYFVSKNRHFIRKSTYNWDTKTFNPPSEFVGSTNKSGFKDGLGTSTLFNEPHQGTFDKEGNFYVADGVNHCIRKVTPEGQVSTFAGRPGNAGYSDGKPRDAQFDRPYGIVYDDDIQTFYIADRNNHRIRTITIE